MCVISIRAQWLKIISSALIHLVETEIDLERERERVGCEVRSAKREAMDWMRARINASSPCMDELERIRE